MVQCYLFRLTSVSCTLVISATRVYPIMLRSYTDKHVPSSQQSNWAQLLPPFLFSLFFAFFPLFSFFFFLFLPTFISQVLLQGISTGWSIFSSSSSSTPHGLEEQRSNGLWEAHSISKGVLNSCFDLRYPWVHGAWDVWGEVRRVSGCVCLWNVHAGDGHLRVPLLRVPECCTDLPQSYQRKSSFQPSSHPSALRSPLPVCQEG